VDVFLQNTGGAQIHQVSVTGGRVEGAFVDGIAAKASSDPAVRK
jgi:hypothetical protein